MKEQDQKLTRRETLKRGLAATSLLAFVPEWAMPALAEGDTENHIRQAFDQQERSACQDKDFEKSPPHVPNPPEAFVNAYSSSSVLLRPRWDAPGGMRGGLWRPGAARSGGNSALEAPASAFSRWIFH